MGIKGFIFGMSVASAVALGSSAQADMTLLTLGDSITDGAGSTHGTGYRLVLDQLLADYYGGQDTGYEFYGSRRDADGGDAASFYNHYGLGGVSANHSGANTWSGDPASVYSGYRSLADRFVDMGDTSDGVRLTPGPRTASDIQTDYYNGSDSTINFDEAVYGAAVSSRAAPNTTLLHIGTNSLNQRNQYTTAADQLSDLLGALDLVRSNTDGSANPLGGGEIYLAKVIPVFGDNFTGNSDAGFADWQFQMFVERTYDYNAQIPGVVNSFATGGDDIADHIHIVDMFAIPVLDVVDLWSMLGYASQADFLAEINPDDEGILNDLSDDYVDWALGSYDESTDSFGGINGRNTLLMSDVYHPTDLGYAVMAGAWATALGVPEPAALVLLGAGSLLFAGRRRRSA